MTKTILAKQPLLPSLEYFRRANHIKIYETGYHEFIVLNFENQPIFTVDQDTTLMCLFCGNSAKFTINVQDNFRYDAMRFERPFLCCWGDEINVYCPPDTYAGKIKQVCPMCTPTFAVMDSVGKRVLTIKTKCCACKFCELKFDILSMDNKVVGCILKDVDDAYTVSFPVDLDLNMKATVLAASILLHNLFFSYEAHDTTVVIV